MPKSKKGRLSGSARKEINQKASNDAVEGRVSGITFARVTRMLGENHIRVAIPSKHGYKECMARIPNKFGKKGSTPLTINNVVSVYVGENFDVEENIEKAHFDVTCILDSKQAYQLVKDGTIPGWMLKSPEEVTSGILKSSTQDGEGFEFDYHEEKEKDKAKESEDGSEEEDEEDKDNAALNVNRIVSKKKSDKDASGGADIPAKKTRDLEDFSIDDI
jgi:hypothetical protein